MDGMSHGLKLLRGPVFITALYTVAKTWKQPKCPNNR